MSKYILPYEKAARIQTVVCGLLFSVFSFVYLYVFQRDILEAVHFSLAHGKTHFAPMASAVVITFILILLRWGVNSLLGLKGIVRSVAYFPSFLILGALTDISRDIYMDSYRGYWLWLLLLILLVFIGTAYFLRRIFRVQLNKEYSFMTLMNSNLIILLVWALMTVGIGNSDRNFHHELAVERCLRAKKYEDALKVGERSLEATRTLTALRAYALAHVGQMGDRLFAYPQYYKSEGLFFSGDSLHDLRYTNDSIYHYLGARPYENESKLLFLQHICDREIGKYTSLDYYLSALLLDKKLKDFAGAMCEFYEENTRIPRYYQEALVMYQSTHPEYTCLAIDSTIVQRFDAYKTRQKDFTSPVEEENRMRREFGDTYWWYYDYQK